MVKKAVALLSKSDKRFLFLLSLFSIVISFIEMIGIGVIFPFISIASDFSEIHSNEYYSAAYLYFGATSEVEFVTYAGIALIAFYLLRSLINLFYYYLISRFSRGRYHVLASRVFRNYLELSYKNYLNKNSSYINKVIVNEVQNLTTFLSGILLLISEIFVAFLIYILMFYVDSQVTIILTIFLIVNAIFLVRFVSRRVKSAGIEREKHQRVFYEIINKSLGNFKVLKLTGGKSKVLHDFKLSSNAYTASNIANETLGHFPRLYLEAVSFSIPLLMAIYVVNAQSDNISDSLPIISMFVLGLYRLMPSVNRIISGYNQALYNRRAVDIVSESLQLNVEELGLEAVDFDRSIKLSNIGFSYSEGNSVLNNISIRIDKGDNVAFIGKSGSGKSTLVDIISGLYMPTSGHVEVDGVIINLDNVQSWRSKIGYIPQSVYLFDGTIAENIALNENIDLDRVREILEQVDMLNFLDIHHQGVDTAVGENGVKLSGGQKQRIAIARALYTNPEILVLDEATSALDQKTEKKIMENIYDISSDKTLIIITHKEVTLYRCKTIYNVDNGKIFRREIE